MARPIYSGAISFGLVTVPVQLYTATSSHRISFHQLQRDTGERIRQKRVVEGTDQEVDYDDIVKGYEVDDGRWITLEREELEAAEPGRTRTIEITDFVDIAEIDPIAWNKTYYLGPQEDVGAERAEPSTVTDLMEALRKSVEQTTTKRKGGAAAAAGSRPSREDLAALNKDELYDRATAADISGRSSMTKDELIEALATAA